MAVLQIVAEQVCEPVHESRERDVAAVGRPGGVEDLPDLGQPDLALYPVVLHVEHREQRLTLAHGAEGEALARGVPRAGRVDELEALVMRVERRLDDPPQHLARARLGEVEVDREEVLLREEDQLPAVGAECRRDVEPGMAVAAHQQPPVRVRRLGLLRQSAVVGLDRGVPAERQRVGADAGDREQRALGVAGPPRLPQDLPDDLVAEVAGDERPECLSVAVGEKARVVQLVDRGKLVTLRGVAQPHGRVRIHGAEREVLRHPLDEPQRQARGARDAEPPLALPGDVELEGVHQLVANHVVRLRERPGERQHDAALEDLRHPARALTQLSRNRVRLLEIRVAGVQDQGLAPVQLVLEELGEAGVPALRQAPRLLGRRPLGRIVVHVEVVGLEDFEGEVPVLDLVASEVLGGGGRGGHGKADDGRGEQRGERKPLGAEARIFHGALHVVCVLHRVVPEASGRRMNPGPLARHGRAGWVVRG